MGFSTYLDIRDTRENEMNLIKLDHQKLNHLHERLMRETVNLSIKRIITEYGPSPYPFCFFVMGSAGRSEQGVWSDQDHGIVYGNTSNEAKDYFLRLGKEISDGLHQTGYQYCDGDVMASNPLWCKPIEEWTNQIDTWIKEASWESIRYLLIFIDGRPLVGEAVFMKQIKLYAIESIHKNQLLSRLLNNTLHIKKGVGILGQLLAETHGPHSGALNLKERALFPYVNGIRLLAIRDKLTETSTLSRLRSLSGRTLSEQDKRLYEQQFLKLLSFRLALADHSNYDSGHYVTIDHLTKNQKAELKEIIKDGAHLFQSIRKIVEKEASNEAK